MLYNVNTMSKEKQNISDKKKVKGIFTFTNYVIESARAIEIDNILSKGNVEQSLFEKLVAELASICKTREVVKENLVVLSGRSVIARVLIGDDTYTGAINYGAIGTGSTGVTSGDTALDTEVKRKPFARRTRTGAQANFDFYFSKNDTDGTYEEFGTFIDGTDTADSGQMFNRVLTGGWVKTDQEAMTVSLEIDINES